ncbi:hypothetical protein M758_10G082700 [Ceratodon purpureus]|uniref:Uncharacterized protein n=1 Tax=Ceratodon purpureus TaxID=3225 RepID=A0A8T0GJJ5_CERPU|nr:hypothetical protein KC19_10G084100 [Ceratodon purpureus]KAG0603301.1 hypothetical protein M758_10G082700 [Ceratodon purpureus]
MNGLVNMIGSMVQLTCIGLFEMVASCCPCLSCFVRKNVLITAKFRWFASLRKKLRLKN